MSSSMEVTSSSSSREIRKIRKPLMERKRRARINDSLDALQRLLTEAEGKDLVQNRQTKLEKADILEMTVRHLQNLNRQQKSSQCCCLTTKHTNNSGNNYCITTSAKRGISRINNFSKKSSDKCSTTPDTNELASSLGNLSGCIPRDDLECANFPGGKSLGNSQFPNKCRFGGVGKSQFPNKRSLGGVENSQFPNTRCSMENYGVENSDSTVKCRLDGVENSQFSNKCGVRKSQFPNKCSLGGVENSQFSNTRCSMENYGGENSDPTVKCRLDGVENSPFSNKCGSRDENLKFLNKCSISDRENPRFFQSSPTSDKENSTISGKYVGNISENSQISKEYLEEFRDFSGVISDDNNFENIDPSSRGLTLKHFCTTHSNPTENSFKYCEFRGSSLKNCTTHSKNLGNSLKNVEYRECTSSLEDSIENQSSKLESSTYSYLLMKNRNSVENNQISLGNPQGGNRFLMGNSLENREPVVTSRNYRGSSWENSVFEMENSDLSPRSDSLNLVPVKLDNGSLAFIVPRSMERHFFEQNSFDKVDSRVLNSNDLSLYSEQNQDSYDKLDNRVLNNNNLSLYNNVRHRNNNVTQNVWRPWF